MAPVECPVGRRFAQVWGDARYRRLIGEASFGAKVKCICLNIAPYIWSHRDNLLRDNHKKCVQRLMQATECRCFKFDRMKRTYLITTSVSSFALCPPMKIPWKQMERGMNSYFLTKPLVWKSSGETTFDHVECNRAAFLLEPVQKFPSLRCPNSRMPFWSSALANFRTWIAKASSEV